MKDEKTNFARWAVTGRDLPRPELVHLDERRPSLVERIRREHPDLTPDALIARSEVARFRSLYVEEMLRDESDENRELERRAAASLSGREMLSCNIEAQFEKERTLGDVLSDRLASFGVSWTFIVIFPKLLGIWMAYNAARAGAAFDPCPFILLNLVLSCLAALQAPIIMMSQKRQEAKDRLRALNDFEVNLKAELEIRHLHEKIDHLISRQWQRLAEIQQLQLEIMQDRRR
ncbi:MAG: DUF1003 domain-containing protein [Deltaproteobacteria bacterium]